MATQDNYARITLRLPKELQERLIEATEESFRSMNAEIVARLEESFASAPPPAPLSEHESAMLVLSSLYRETQERIAQLKSLTTLSSMDEVELLHEEATAKYLRHAMARAALPAEERPPVRKQSMPLGISSDAHLAIRTAEATSPDKPKK